jgi:protein TonB
MRLLLPFVAILCAAPPGAAAPAYMPKFARVEHEPASEPCALPAYPKSSLRNGEAGKPTLRYTVDESGMLVNVVVLKSSGFRDLDKAALRAFEKCRFSAATINGRAVRASGLVQYDWRLE